MDYLQTEKTLAMNKYNKRGTQEQNLLLPRLPAIVNYAFTSLKFLLFVTSPVWVPEVFGQLKLIFYAYLPTMITFFTGPKFLFIVCNLIIFILVSESKLLRSPSAGNMYEEKLLKNMSNKSCHPSVAKTSLGGHEEKENEKEDFYVSEVEEEGDPVELHQKVEDFIARVKSQRRTEAKIFLCY